jgi:hypothetical protein
MLHSNRLYSSFVLRHFKQLPSIDSDPALAIALLLTPVSNLLGTQILVPLIELGHAGAHASMTRPESATILMPSILAALLIKCLSLVQHYQRTSNSLVIRHEQIDDVILGHVHSLTTISVV